MYVLQCNSLSLYCMSTLIARLHAQSDFVYVESNMDAHCTRSLELYVWNDA